MNKKQATIMTISILVMSTIFLTANTAQAQTDTVDNGDFKLIYGPNPNSIYNGIPNAISNAQWLQNIELLDNEVKWLNEHFNLPHDIIIHAQECGAVNAYYDPSEKKVIICYELIDDLDRMQYTHDLDIFFAEDVTNFIFYHEIGHAILDTYNLPFSGNEETVADQFATLIMASIQTDTNPNLGHKILDNTQYFFIHLDSGANYASLHDTDFKRYTNIACWSYGSDPIYNTYLLFDGSVSPTRTTSCLEQYSQIPRYWNFILANHVPYESFFKPQDAPTPPPPTPPPPDTTPPIIVLIGSNNTDITQGNSYKDDGAICFDKNDGIITTITDNAANIDTTNTGSQTITYTCTDSAGNTEIETRTIIINAPTPPPTTTTPDLITPLGNMKTNPPPIDTTPFNQTDINNALTQQRNILQAEHNATLNTLQEKYNTLQNTYDTLAASIAEVNRLIDIIISLYA